MKHGPAAGHRGVIALEVVLREGHIEVTLENPGPYRGPRPGSDGIPTVEKRLRLAFAKDAAVTLEDVGGRTRTRLVMPRAAGGTP